MKLQEIYNILETEIPKKLSDDFVAKFNGHDNSGILVDTGIDIKKAVFALDLTNGAINQAKKIGANLIVTHHPAIFYPISNICTENVLGKKLIECIANGISVIAMHLNADCAPLGVDYHLAKAVGARDGENIPKQCVEGGGYGRVFSIEEQTVEELSKKVKNELGAKNVWVFGKENIVKKAATFCGAGVDNSTMAIAKQNGANVIISADIKHNYVSDALDLKMSVIQFTHYASENYGFKKIYQILKDKLGVYSEYRDEDVML